MSSALYQAEIKQLARRQFGTDSLVNPDHRVTLDNPLCGDRVSMDIQIRDGHIYAQAHRVRGCLLCQAAANLIGGAIVGTPIAEVEEIHKTILRLLQESGDQSPPPDWEELALFQPVANYKSRHECVLLPFRALASIAKKQQEAES